MNLEANLRQELIHPHMDHEELISQLKRELIRDLSVKIMEEFENNIEVIVEEHNPTFSHGVINMRLQLDVNPSNGFSTGGFVEHGDGYLLTIDEFREESFDCKV